MKKKIKNIAKKLLKKLGLLEVYRRWKSRIGRAKINRDIECVLNNIENYQRQPDKKMVLVTGHILLEKKRFFLKLLVEMAARMPETEFLILDEARADAHNFEYPGIMRIEIPNIYRNANYIYRDDEEIKNLFLGKKYMYQSMQNMVMKGRSKFYSENLLYVYSRIYRHAATKLKPDLVLLWSKFSAVHSMCDCIFKESHIKMNYLEYGSLPGTYGIEGIGQMGESFPAKDFRRFLKMPVSEAEVQKADEIWDYLYTSGLNRNSQIKDQMEDHIKTLINNGRPIILFAGNLDYDSGIVPYTLQSKSFHSPMFQSSEQAVNYLAVLAEKNDWNLIFKPHPSIANKYKMTNLPQNVIFIKNGNLNNLIDLADVVVTIMSQTAYVSCIRKHPVVMLGYNQLRGKGCTYEAYELERIEGVINKAIKDGFSLEQQNAFQTHIAQMCKYYLYDDQTDKKINYGRSIDDAVKYLRKELEVL